MNNNDCSDHPTVTADFLQSSLRFILVETSRPGNIGAAARAIKNMGYSRLVLVRPRFSDPATQPEAIAFASGAQDVLAAAQIVDSIDAALDQCTIVAAVSARLREFSPPLITPRAWAMRLADTSAVQNGFQAALVFGNERFGLPNEIVERCDVLINIPANPAYASLNLAQAIQILSYECAVASHFADGANPRLASTVGFTGQTAEKSQINAMFDHLEQALVAIDFLDPDNPKKLMSRMRRLFARSGLETEEVNILRGIASHILKGRR